MAVLEIEVKVLETAQNRYKLGATFHQNRSISYSAVLSFKKLSCLHKVLLKMSEMLWPAST